MRSRGLEITVALLAFLHGMAGRVIAQTVDPAVAAAQEEIRKAALAQAEKYNGIHISYSQTYFSGNQPVKCKVFVSPEGVLAESDFWLLAVTPTRAFALSKYNGRFRLLGLEDYTEGKDRLDRVAKVAKNFGGSGTHLLPFEATGPLGIFPSTMMFRVAELTSSQKSTPVTRVQDGPDGRTVIDYKIPSPPGADILPQGRAVDVDGTLSLEKSAGYRMIAHEMRTVSSRSQAVTKEAVQYQVPLPELGLAFFKSYERIRSSEAGKKPDKVRVEYGDFHHEKLDPSRLLLEHYDLTPPARASTFSWMMGAGVAGVLVVFGYLVFRRFSARRRSV